MKYSLITLTLLLTLNLQAQKLNYQSTIEDIIKIVEFSYVTPHNNIKYEEGYLVEQVIIAKDSCNNIIRIHQDYYVKSYNHQRYYLKHYSNGWIVNWNSNVYNKRKPLGFIRNLFYHKPKQVWDIHFKNEIRTANR